MKNLTIVVSVHVRQGTLYRLLPHLSQFGCRVIVVDSSPTPFDQGFLESYQCEYVYDPGVSYFQNNLNGLRRISTDYVVQLADDDFLIPSTVQQCIDFLDSHSNYVYAHGMYLKFRELDGNFLKNFGIEPNLLNRGHQPRDSFPERLSNIFNVFQAPNHAVVRSRAILEVFEFVIRHEDFQPVRYFDKLMALFFSLHGNGKTFPDLYQLRSDDRLIDRQDYPEELKRDVSAKTLKRLLEDSKSAINQHVVEQYPQCSSEFMQFSADVIGDYEEQNRRKIDSLKTRLVTEKVQLNDGSSMLQIDVQLLSALQKKQNEAEDIIKRVKAKPVVT